MKTSHFDPSRRNFLRQGCCAALGATGYLSALAQLKLVGAIAAPSAPARAAAHPADYKALVCVFLLGGNDSNSMLIPSDTAGYTAYAAARGAVTIDRSGLLPITPARYRDGRDYALHPALRDLQELFSQGKLAILANVGTLVQPTTLASYRAGAGLPPHLFSHFDQSIQWQSSVPDQAFDTGWGGRLADLTDALNANQAISMSVSLDGTNQFQVGRAVSQFTVSETGPAVLTGKAPAGNNALRYQAARALMSTRESNLLAAAFNDMTGTSIALGDQLSTILGATAPLRAAFPSTFLGRQLQTTARLISIAPALGLKRQIFFVRLGGWDLHSLQADAHGPLLTQLSQTLKAFYDAMVELGVENQVTAFTASDFSRSYTSNNNGTDHAWGGHHLILGGAVRGGDIYGTMPSLALNGPDDLGRGTWIPSTSVDEYNATLASWFGVSAANLPVVLPNIGRFARPNLGFMG